MQLVPSRQERRAHVARARRLFLRGWGAGCFILIVAMLLWPSAGDGALGAMVLVGAILMPTCGIVLGSLALYERSREAALAVLVAALSLAGMVASLPAVRGVAVEVYVAAHQAELEQLAGEIRIAMPVSAIQEESQGLLEERIEKTFGTRMRALGLSTVDLVDGGVLFRGLPKLGAVLVYADGIPAPSTDCRGQRLHAIGGRWFTRTCAPWRPSDDVDVTPQAER